MFYAKIDNDMESLCQGKETIAIMSYQMYAGKTYRLKVKGTSRKAKWSSNKKSVATVTSKGKVKERIYTKFLYYRSYRPR